MRSTRLLPGDPGYPPALSGPASLVASPEPGGKVADPPALYVRGEIPAATGLAIVGTRQPSDEASAFARALVRDLAAAGLCVWSGGALGIDTAVHEAAIDAGAPTVVVMGGGLGMPYPRENIPLFDRVLASGGALVARVPDDVPPSPPGFFLRNGILAAATAATIVVQAGFQSGARSTATAARKHARPLCIVPHAPWDELGAGCALELSLGAYAITCAADVLAVLGGAGHLVTPRPRPRRSRARMGVGVGVGVAMDADARANANANARATNNQLGLPSEARGSETALSKKNDEAVEPHGLSSALEVAGPELGPDERAILRVLDVRGDSPVHIDEVCEEAGLPIRVAVGLLLTLTLQAVVVEGPAGFYRRARC